MLHPFSKHQLSVPCNRLRPAIPEIQKTTAAYQPGSHLYMNMLDKDWKWVNLSEICK